MFLSKHNDNNDNDNDNENKNKKNNHILHNPFPLPFSKRLCMCVFFHTQMCEKSHFLEKATPGGCTVGVMGVTGVASPVGDVGEPGASRRFLEDERKRLRRKRFDDDRRPARSSGRGSVGDGRGGDIAGDGEGDGVRRAQNHGLQPASLLLSSSPALRSDSETSSPLSLDVALLLSRSLPRRLCPCALTGVGGVAGLRTRLVPINGPAHVPVRLRPCAMSATRRSSCMCECCTGTVLLVMTVVGDHTEFALLALLVVLQKPPLPRSFSRTGTIVRAVLLRLKRVWTLFVVGAAVSAAGVIGGR